MSQPTKYRDIKALSQSSLKALDWNPKKFYEDEYLWLQGMVPTRPEHSISDSMKIGELVDIHFTRPEDLDSEYVIMPEGPTGQMLAFVESFFQLTIGVTDEEIKSEDLTKEAQEAYVIAGFKRDKLETVLERFKTEGALYYTALRKSIGKTVASPEVRRSADYIIKSFEQDQFIGPIMRLKETPMLKIYNQMEIYFQYNGVALKALLDKVVVDHIARTIQPYDIKTASDVFPNSFMNWRYDLQGAFYTLAIREWTWRQSNIPHNSYEILPFKFIVGYSTGQRPEIWEMTRGDLKAGTEGGVNRFGRKVKGYKQLIEQYEWHVENNKWDYSQEVYESNGVRLLNCYKDE